MNGESHGCFEAFFEEHVDLAVVGCHCDEAVCGCCDELLDVWPEGP